mmetsp:Transcript_8416/g.14090  ORF Transcript_8416/g.14090 Transcript_8416/m.14090 type:complete len:147 (+) Transcript_8416:895-1335(+)
MLNEKDDRGEFKVPFGRLSDQERSCTRYQLQGLKAREALGLYLADSAFRKKREQKAESKGQACTMSNINLSQTIRDDSAHRSLPPNTVCQSSAASVKSFKTAKQSVVSRLSQTSQMSQRSMKYKLSQLSGAGLKLLQTAARKKGKE